eukprot:354103-Chlamydomonas_euryale.AAC.3
MRGHAQALNDEWVQEEEADAAEEALYEDFLKVVWGLVHGSWCMMHDAWCMVHGAWRMVHGAWCMAHGAWCMMHGA